MNLKRALFKLKRYYFLKTSVAVRPIKSERIGSDYGGWAIPVGLLNKNSICYLAGVGEDISFDLGIANKYGCSAFLFDPTPRALVHYNQLTKAVAQNVAMRYNNTEVYNTSAKAINCLSFVAKGLWGNKETLKFYKPVNDQHVSHSALNLHKTTDYFEAEADTVTAFMNQFGHKELDLLKLDIEGAEYKVLDSVLENKAKIKVICVEFDESHTPLDNDYLKRIKAAIQQLKAAAYVITHIDKEYNYTFVRNDIFETLKH